MSDQVLRLVEDQNSSDNNVRTRAELNFNQLAAQNSSQLAFHLIDACGSPLVPLYIRQSCLLHLKRLVPKFWSMGFELFVGPPIDQELKAMIRSRLLDLATSAELKIRSGSAYVIVQIAAADYPDEWPDLLDQLYRRSTDLSNVTAVVGSLAVLNDLFDDLITEDQFWEGGVGAKLISHISEILAQNALSSSVKAAALKLYWTVFNTLLSAEAMEVTERRTAVNHHIASFAELLQSLLQKLYSASSSLNVVLLVELDYRCKLYNTISRILSDFRRLVGPHLRHSILETVLPDLSYGARLFDVILVNAGDVGSIEKTDDQDDLNKCIIDYLCELFLTLSSLQHGFVLKNSVSEEAFTTFVQNLVQCSTLPEESVETFTDDFNAFVTDATGLSSLSTVRDSIGEFLMDLNDIDASGVFNAILGNAVGGQLQWKTKESYLFLVESLFLNEDAESIGQDLSLSAYLTSLNTMVSVEQGPYNHPLVIARILLVLPRFFEKFSLKLDVNSFGANNFTNTLAYASSSTTVDLFELVRAAALVSTTLWKYIQGFSLSKLPNAAQADIFKICLAVLDDSDEDTLPVLLEAISVAIDIDHQYPHQSDNIETTVVDLIFKISFKDPANIQLAIDSAESLRTLLSGITAEQYLRMCHKLVPFILNIISGPLSAANVEYTPELYLALELLGYVIGAAPSSPDQANSDSFPSDIFRYTFPILKELILRTNDDQILQNGGEVFNNLLQKAPKFFVEYIDAATNKSGLEVLLEVASKFMSPELSDSAAMNSGLIVISLFENFLSFLDGNFFFELLQATVRRVVIAKEVVTIENLIMVFCKLVLNASPEQLIDALTSVQIDGKNGLELVLPIWFGSFEITRGFEKIKQNILALGKIFSLNDERVASLIVDGDLIPYEGDLIITRSMAKSMPEKYTQIPAPLKIIKLLAGELEFQSQQPDPKHFLPEADHQAEEDDGGWEDMDDIGVPNYEKLKSYVDSEDEDAGNDSTDQGIKDMLVQFFRECTSKNLGNFQQYYERLSDEEKRTITENLVF